MGVLDSIIKEASKNSVTLYHGSKFKVEKPLFGFGKTDNDYGSGFYTTPIKEKAEDWSLITGETDSVGIVNIYELDLTNLNVVNLDDYGVLAWIAEIVSNRFIDSFGLLEFRDEFIEMYKVDTSHADVIIGYRADDSYSYVIEAFLNNKVTEQEVKKLFYKGNLGVQYFIKSKKAFDTIKFIDSYSVKGETSNEEQIARRKVLNFLTKRESEILRKSFNGHLTMLDVVCDKYIYNKEYDYYDKM